MAQDVTAGRGASGVMPIVGAFIAGVVGVLIFHQLTFVVLNLIGIAPPAAYNFSTPTKPLGVPVALSLAFWGGVWAILMSWLLRGRTGAGYWWFATLFGAIVVTLGAWFLVPWIKGLPTRFEQPINLSIIIGPIVNGAWGFGTALVLRLLPPGWAWR